MSLFNRRQFFTFTAAAFCSLFALTTLASAQGENQPPATQPAEEKTTDTLTTDDKENDMEYVLVETNKGDMLFELNREDAPKSVENFLKYVEAEFYDGTIFHRVMSNFMIQGGGFTRSLQKKDTNKPIENEAGNGLRNERGSIAMARTNDPNSATSQFFINVVDNDFLNRDQAQDGVGYAVFGKVIAGMDTVDRIREVMTTSVQGMQNVPIEPVTMEKVRQVEADEIEALTEKIEADG